jgi:glycosyltransferase involved in cell wall biosynthesis
LNFKEWHPRYLNTLAKLLSNIKVAYLFYRFIRKYQKNYDLAFVHHFYFSPLALPFFKIPKIYYCQEPPRGYYEPNICTYKRGFTKPLNILIFSLEKILDRYCVRSADLVISNSDYTREYIYRVYGVFAKTNYLGVDVEEFRKLENIKKENIVLSVGPLHSMKAHDFVIRSLSKINKDIRPKLIILGKGKEEERFYKFADNLNVDLKIMYLKYEEMVKLYNCARLTLVASIMEPFGLSVIESMACQTPVVAVREAGLRETVTEETGILVERDEEKFAEAIEYLIQNPEIAQEMGRKARKRIEERFRWERNIEQLEKDIKEIIRRSK